MIEQLEVLRSGNDLSVDQTKNGFQQIMTGQVPDDQLAEFLTRLADKGETVDELVGAAQVMREMAAPVRCGDPDVIDTCGTGGDGISTFNISTTAGIVAAAAGACVAKHGNRSVTRVSGSAEVLDALGVNIDANIETMERCLDEVGFAFLFAVNLHPAMKHAIGVRKQLGRRTIFNLVGPLTNPASARRQLLGVSRADLMGKMAEALSRLDAVRAMVVHGHGGLCDLSLSGPSSAIELKDGRIESREISPESLELGGAEVEEITVDSPAASAESVRGVLSGVPGPKRDIVILNAAAALVIAGKAEDLGGAAELAQNAIDSGKANDLLLRVCEISQS
jgi:anthranilate phosphoribosyltransferase